MDTDGSCSEKGLIELSSSFPDLAKDIEKLIRSLGIAVKCKTKKTFYKKENKKIKCKDATRFSIFTDEIIFSIKRKIENQLKASHKNKGNKKSQHYKERVAIVDVTPIEKAKATCIRVNNDSHLF